MTKPNIYTIAARAGVSIATVSRAFNDSPRIKEATRARILQVAADLGYQPNAFARSLVLNATETLGLVFPQIATSFFSEFIRGAESMARRRHYHLLVYSCSAADEEDPLLRILPSRTDGIIFGIRPGAAAFTQRLDRQNFPYLWLGQPAESASHGGIYPDNTGGAYELTRHLIARHAYSSIAFISGPPDQAHSVERQAGYLRALAEAGIPGDPAWIVPGTFDEASGYSAAQSLLRAAAPPRAIFAGNDQMAIGALSAAKEMGLRVPEDVAIVGFDDIPSARYLTPPLTTVNQSIFEQGEQAVELLLRLIADPQRAGETIPIPTTLMIRRSCGCAESEGSLNHRGD